MCAATPRRGSLLYKKIAFVVCVAAVAVVPLSVYAALPDGYAQLDWVESDGTAYINTGVVPTQTMEFTFKFQPETHQDYRGAFGSYVDESSLTTRIIFNGTSSTSFLVSHLSRAGGGGVSFNNVVSGLGQPIEGYFNHSYARLNNVEHSLSAAAGTATSAPMKLGRSSAGASTSRQKIFYFKITEGSTLLRDFVPARRESDSAIGFYDRANSVFYGNAEASGAFTAGPTAAAETTYYSAKGNNVDETSLASPGVAGAWTNATGVSRNYIDDSTGGDVFVIRHYLRTTMGYNLGINKNELQFDGGTVLSKMSANGNIVFGNMKVLAGKTGTIDLGSENRKVNLGGNYEIGAGGQLTLKYAPADTRSLALNAAVTGTGKLVCSGGDANGFVDVSAGALSGFKGPILVTSTGVNPYVIFRGNLGAPDTFLADGLALSGKGHVVFSMTNTTYTIPANRGVTIANGAVAQIEVPAGMTLTVEGPVSGSGTLVKTGGGKIVFSSPSSNFTGSFVIRSGTADTEGIFPNATVSRDTRYDANGYARDGLVLQYDALEPGGDAGKWKNLASTGSTYDLTLPSWVMREDGAFRSSAIRGLTQSEIGSSKTGLCPVFASVDGITSETTVTTVEVVMQLLTWVYTDNYGNTQYVIGTPYGSLGYRQSNSDGHYVSVPVTTDKRNIYHLFSGESTKTLKTFTATMGLNQNSALFDGVDYDQSRWVYNYQLDKAASYTFFPNLRSDIRVCAIRLYNRRLTPDEIAANAALDGLRFHGRTIPAELQFAVADIPEQDWNGLDDACPKVTVADRCRAGRLLVQGVDYAVAYEGNSAPGKGKVIVRGLGEYAGLEVTKEFSIRSAIEVTVQGDGRKAKVTFPAADVVRNIYVATATSDYGRDKANWPSASLVTTVPSGATEANVAVPEGAGTTWTTMRFFISTPATSASYVTEGLVLQYDGVDNSVVDGVRTHLDSPTVLANLTGNGKDIPKPSFLDIEANAFYSNALKDNRPSVNVSNIPFVPTVPTELTAEYAAQFVRWVYTDSYGNLQVVMATPLGTICYRENLENGFSVGCYGYHQTQHKYGLCYWTYKPSSLSVADVHTLTARVRSEAASYFIDGGYRFNSESYTIGSNSGELQSCWFNPNSASVGTNVTFFSNSRGDVRVFTMRLYNRKLARAEVARNAAVDAARFKGAEICAASEAVAWCAANPVMSGADATVSVVPARVARDLYVAWGAEDRGAAMTNWTNTAKVGTIPANVSSAVVRLPTMAKPRTVARLFIEKACDSSAYVKTGLILQLDGVDNAVDGSGVPYHDADARTWKDLSGNVADPIPLPEWVTVEADAVYSQSATDHAATVFAVPGVSTEDSPVLTVESVSQRGIWRLTDSMGSLQATIWTGRGFFCYRLSEGVAFQCHKNYGTLGVLTLDNVDPTNVHSHALTLGHEEHALWIDGERKSLSGLEWDGWTTAPTTSGDCKMFNNPRADIRMKSIRIYSRGLTDDEIRQNAAIDAVRFQGAQAPLVASSPFEPRGGMIIMYK